jgi:hypothetical protein
MSVARYLFSFMLLLQTVCLVNSFTSSSQHGLRRELRGSKIRISKDPYDEAFLIGPDSNWSMVSDPANTNVPFIPATLLERMKYSKFLDEKTRKKGNNGFKKWLDNFLSRET